MDILSKLLFLDGHMKYRVHVKLAEAETIIKKKKLTNGSIKLPNRILRYDYDIILRLIPEIFQCETENIRFLKCYQQKFKG